MTSTLTLFPQWDKIHKSFDPFTIGFDDVIDKLQAMHTDMAKTVPGYPPYNIRQVKDNKYVIEMAVAGFAKSDIEVTLEGDKLVIKGTSKDNETEGSYIFKGIADRAFTRQFTLADTVVVKNAEMANGLLKIFLERFIPEEKKAKKIDILDPFGVGEATRQFLSEATAFQKQLAGEKTGKKVA